MSALLPHLTMITGKKGSGKSLYAVSLIEQAIKENEQLIKNGLEPRAIYTDITDIKFEGVLPAPLDWRETPMNSIIFYDEIQNNDLFKRTGKRMNDNPIISEFTLMRKTNHIIYLITQHPQFIDMTVCRLVDHHLHVVRGFGLPAANIYHWEGYCSNPDDPTNKSRAISEIKFSHPKKLFDKYKSGEVKDSIKTKIPTKIKMMVIFIIMLICGLVYFGMRSNFKEIATGEAGREVIQGSSDHPVDQKSVQSDSSQSSTTNQELQRARQEILDLKKQLLGKRAVYIGDEDIRPAMIVGSGSSCRAFNSYGDLLYVSASECSDMRNDFSLIPASRVQRATARRDDDQNSSEPDLRPVS